MDLMTLYSMAEKLGISYVTAVVITGLSVVFLALILLIIFVWAFGKSCKKQAFKICMVICWYSE